MLETVLSDGAMLDPLFMQLLFLLLHIRQSVVGPSRLMDRPPHVTWQCDSSGINKHVWCVLTTSVSTPYTRNPYITP